MKKKALALVLSCAMVAAALTGCGGSSSTTEPAASSEAAPAETTAETTEETPAAETTEEAAAETTDAAASTDSITYWSMWTSEEPQAKVIQEVADAYEAQTGIHVNIEWKGRDIQTIIVAALEAGESIDVFDDDFQRVSENYSQYCMDLEDMAAAADYESHSVEALPAAVRGWAGSLKAIAYQPYTSGIFYNKAIFEEAGVTEEPQTFDELLDACQKIKDAGYVPIALDDAYVLYNYGFHLARYIGQDAIKDMVTNGTWADVPEAKQAAEDMLTLVENEYIDPMAPEAYPASENQIGYGETAMLVNASWVPAEITNNTECDIEWGMFNYPSVEGGTDPNTIANVGAQALAIPSYSENGQAAFDFIMMITTGEYDQKMALDTNSIPADPTNEEWPEMIAGCKDGFNALTNVYEWNCGLNANSDMGEIIKDAVLKLFEGSLSADEFITTLAESY